MSIRARLKYLIPVVALCLAVSILSGCAAPSEKTMQSRLDAMSDEELINYYHGINDRIKAIQEGTREADRQGTISQEDQLAKMPYIIGGEAWELEKRRGRVERELDRRDLRP